MKILLMLSVMATLSLSAGCTKNITRNTRPNPNSTIRIFSDLFSIYKQDSKASKLPEEKWYPDRVIDFVKNGYITESDLNKLTKGMTVIYLKPRKQSDAAIDPVILTAIYNDSYGTDAYGELRASGSTLFRTGECIP